MSKLPGIFGNSICLSRQRPRLKSTRSGNRGGSLFPDTYFLYNLTNIYTDSIMPQPNKENKQESGGRWRGHGSAV
jgi:hypothetical protein